MDQDRLRELNIRIEPGAILRLEQGAILIGADALLRSGTVVYEGCVIGERFKTGHGAVIRRSCVIDDDVIVGSHSELGHCVRIGSGTHVHSHVFVSEWTRIGKRCFIGPGALLLNSKYPFSPGAKQNLEPPTLGDDVKIGGGAIIMPGVTIGPGALIGAGAVVTHDVPSRAVVLGIPARWYADVRSLGVGYGDQTD